MKKYLIICLVLACSAAFAGGVGTDVLNFLKIKPSARAASIGDGFVAVADDSNAVFFNPAGLTQLNGMEISLMHMPYLMDTSYEYASFAMPAGENLRLGVYVIYMNYGSFARAAEDTFGIYDPASTGTYSANDLAVALSGAMKLGEISVGLNVKYATETVDALTISGVMADAGVLAEVEGVKVGAAIYNIGSTSTNTAPMSFRLGGSSKFTAMTADDLTAAAGFSYALSGGKMSASLGGEWKYENFLFIRGSYTFLSDSDSLNAGLGFRQDLGGMVGEVAYNFSLLGDLGSAHRISVGLKFGGDEGSGRKKKSSNVKTNTNSVNSKTSLKYYFKKK